MIDRLKEKYTGKSIVILGFGREGKSTLAILQKAGLADCITIADKMDVSETAKEAGCRYICGDDYQKTLDDYDVVFKSPGIVLEREYDSYKCIITSQTQEFTEAYRERIIGITGTKGKSTTVTLLHHILRESGHKVCLGGNIGIPVFELAEEMSANAEMLAVVELSCHQLEYMTVSPKWSVLINLYEEHLDHYGTFEKYIAAKKHIYAYCKQGDKFFCKDDIVPEKEEFLTGEMPDIVTISGETVENLEIPTEDIKLLGKHNLFNVALVHEIIREFSVGENDFIKALISYNPLPHRLQLVYEEAGVRYYDDSISTIGETTIQAVKSVKNVQTILVGGMDRGIVYDDLEEFLSSRPVKNIILMYETGKRIYDEMSKKNMCRSGIVVVDNLEEAVKKAKEVTVSGEACVMSPAAASYGYFKNFEERGEVFSRLVRM